MHFWRVNQNRTFRTFRRETEGRYLDNTDANVRKAAFDWLESQVRVPEDVLPDINYNIWIDNGLILVKLARYS
jgi:hypothetical protein